ARVDRRRDNDARSPSQPRVESGQGTSPQSEPARAADRDTARREKRATPTVAARKSAADRSTAGALVADTGPTAGTGPAEDRAPVVADKALAAAAGKALVAQDIAARIPGPRTLRRRPTLQPRTAFENTRWS